MLEREGRVIGQMDMLIAVQAIPNSLTISQKTPSVDFFGVGFQYQVLKTSHFPLLLKYLIGRGKKRRGNLSH
jgi:hypothetical protein